jgi:sugar phosphate isomerase/epimerase
MPEIYQHSFIFRRYSFERAARRAKENGYDGLELFAGHFRLDHLWEDLDDVRRISREVGIPVPAINLHSHVIGDDPEERRQRVAWLSEVIARLPDYGFRIMNGFAGALITGPTEFFLQDWGKNGSAAATEEHYERAVDAYRQLGEVARRAGLLLTLEVHMNTIHDTAATARRLVDAVDSPAVRANLDAGNMLGVPHAEPAVEGVGILGPRIAYAHVKNARKAPYIPVGIDYNWRLPQGEVDYYAVVAALVHQGFGGPYTIEWSGTGDPDVAATEDLRYLKGVLAAVAADDAAEGARARDQKALEGAAGPE